MGDRASIELLGEQEELAEAMFNLGKPVIVVLINGRPQSISENIRTRAHAIIEGWYLGQEAGTAMAQILFGDANPGGKLPVTIARHAGQLPHFYNMKPSARRGYLFEDNTPLFPFGFGLSYTSFELSPPRLSAATIPVDGAVDVSVDVRNSGARVGDEVVQIYIRDSVSSVTRPVKELKAFKRVTLQPGESTTVTLRLDSTAFRFWNADMARVVEPGQFEIMAGPNSVDLQSVTLTVA
jgi:beta-glucosidase